MYTKMQMYRKADSQPARQTDRREGTPKQKFIRQRGLQNVKQRTHRKRRQTQTDKQRDRQTDANRLEDGNWRLTTPSYCLRHSLERSVITKSDEWSASVTDPKVWCSWSVSAPSTAQKRTPLGSAKRCRGSQVSQSDRRNRTPTAYQPGSRNWTPVLCFTACHHSVEWL